MSGCQSSCTNARFNSIFQYMSVRPCATNVLEFTQNNLKICNKSVFSKRLDHIMCQSVNIGLNNVQVSCTDKTTV